MAGDTAAVTDRGFSRFEASRTDHSWSNVYLLAWASYYAYPSKVQDQPGTDLMGKLRSRFGREILEVVAFLDERTFGIDTKAVILRSEAAVVVAFVGSEADGLVAALRDGATSLRVGQVSMAGGLVHAGFRQALDAIYAPLQAAMEEHLTGGRTLWLTGHSLGGALATLAAYRLEEDGIPVQGVVIYGSPKVGDPAWAREFDSHLGSRAQAWVTARDPVPFSPPNLHGRNYRRSAIQNVISRGGRFELNTTPEGSPAMDPMDHRMGIYVNLLYRALADELREAMPAPPPVCDTAQRLVAVHPDTGYPLCMFLTARKIHGAACRRKGGDIVQRWCAIEVPGEFRYRARLLKSPPSG
jgi:triacylglycerol lipase